MSQLSEALGKGTPVAFGSMILTIEPLDFNDLLELEEFAGVDADDLDISEFIKDRRSRLFFLWLVLRKADPALSPEERERGEYRMTEKEAGYLLKRDSTVEQLSLIKAAIGLSGLEGSAEEEGPKPAPATEAVKPARKARAYPPKESDPAPAD